MLAIVVSLQPAHIRVRRNEALWDLKPSVLAFWEPLGLAPTNGPKNILTYCIYPANEDLRAQVGLFMNHLGAAYEGCRLGSHTRGDKLCDYDNGLLPLELSTQYTYDHAVQTLRKLCFAIGNQLAKLDTRNSQNSTKPEDSTQVDNFVIYIVNPFRSVAALKDICHAFWTLYHTYLTTQRSPTLPKRKLDLVLQIIPVKYIASPGAPVVLEPSMLRNLAREVYNRCPPATPSEEPSRLRIPSAASIQLEEIPPKSIQFKLTAESPSDLLYENSHIHVGYAISPGRDWITAAWTDNAGKYQSTASYCLASGNRTFFEVAREIWQTTIDIISVRRVQWRICIAKAGLVEREELEAWMTLTTMGAPIPIIAMVTAVDKDPHLSMFPKAALSLVVANSAAPGGNGSVSTPVSTPQPGISPDPGSATPATPSAADGTAEAIANDPDAHLVDVTDETWAIILAHRVNVSGDMREYRPSLSSGLMIKVAVDAASTTPFTDSDTDEAPAPLFAAVHLLWVGGASRGPQNNSNSSTPSSPTSLALASAANLASNPPDNNAAAPSNPQQPPQQWTGMLPKTTTDNLLREYMQAYRNLGLLARVRGMRGTRRGLLPWHLAAAVRGSGGLEMIMR